MFYKLTYSTMLFYSTLIISTLIVMSSNSWLNSWIGLEINLLSFIPLLSNSNNLMSNESSFKYFLIQALGSSILLFSIIILMLNMNNSILPKSFALILMMSSLLLKMGASPFHFWFPMLVEGMSWVNLLTLMTWQKLAPLTLISYTSNNYMLVISALMSAIMGAIGGINQTSIRKLMAFSSINHLGWMLLVIYFNKFLWIMYFMIYSIILTSSIYLFNLAKISSTSQMMNFNLNPSYMTFIILLNMLSLGGLPPFLGFLPKWLVIQYLTLNGQLMIMILMVTLSLITLFFYLRLGYSSFMMGHLQNSWSNLSLFLMKSPMLLWMTTFMSTMGFFILSMTSFNF